MEGDARELLAFRGSHEVLEKVQEDLYNRLEAYIAGGEL
jgi:DNA replication initiation complex subunit (GINS family)